MEVVYKFLLGTHIFFGSISLVIFWLPAVFTKKGGDWHNRIGRWYVRLMWIVLISAALMSIRNFIVGRYFSASFLGFLTLLTARPIWYGIAILKYKKEQPISFVKLHLLFRAIVILAAVGLIGYGIYLHSLGKMQPLFYIFGFIGLSDIREWIREYKNPPTHSNWIVKHLQGMLIGGIAAYTAFFAFGGGTLFAEILPGNLQIIPWVLPTIIGIIGITIQTKKYTKSKAKVATN